MNIKSNDNKFLMKSYEKILKNCNESLEKYKISQNPSSSVARKDLFKRDLKQETSENSRNSGKKLKKKLQYDCLHKLQQSPWADVIPPIWDDGLTKNYVESLVDEFFSEKSTIFTESSSDKSITIGHEPRKELLKKDQAILVKDSDFPDDKVQAVWKLVNEDRTKSPKKTISPVKEFSNPEPSNITKTKIITPLLLKPDIQQYKKTSVKSSPLATSRRKLDKKQSSPLNQEPSRRRGQYLRFIGKPRTTPFDFNAEHPGLIILDETPATTAFPCRVDRPNPSTQESDGEVVNEKSNVISREPLNDKSFSAENERFNATIGSPNKTWHEVLSQRITDGNGERILKYKWVDSGRQTDRQSSPNITEIKEDRRVGHDVIYDSERIIRADEKYSPTNLKIQQLPVLCIRGACKVQKVVEISINASEEGAYELGKAENVNFFQCCHREQQKPLAAPTVLSENVQQENVDQENDRLVNSKGSKSSISASVVENKAAIPQSNTEFSAKSVNKYLAPFIAVDSSDIKITSSEELPKSGIAETSNGTSTINASQSSSNVNNSDLSTTQTDDEKLRKRNSLKAPTLSLSSSTFPQTTSEDFQSNKIRDSPRTIFSISGDVSSHHFFDDEENVQILLKHPEDVQNILKEVLSLTDSEDDNPPRCKQTEKIRTTTVGIDCADLTPGIEISVQTDDILGNYSKGQQLRIEEKDELFQGSKDIGALVLDSSNGEQSKRLVDEMVEKICKDETEGLRNFKSRILNPVKCRSKINEPSNLKHFEVANVNNCKINDRNSEEPIIETITGNNVEPLGNHPVNEMIQVETSTDLMAETNIGGGDNAFKVGGGNYNYMDNRRAIKGDEVEERYHHQLDELSSPCCLSSYSNNLFGRKCYCTEDGGKVPSENIMKPLVVLHDNNLPPSTISLQSNCGVTTAQNNRKSTYKEFQRKVLEQNPRFSKTITKIYDAVPDITTKSSSNRMDPEVQRAVKKFLQSLSEPPNSPLYRKYSATMLRHRELCTDFDKIALLPTPAATSINGRQTSKRWASNSTSSSVSSTSPKHFTFSGLWKSNDSSISDTESSELQGLLDASPLENECLIKKRTTTTTFSSYNPEVDNPRSLTESSNSLIISPRVKSSCCFALTKGRPAESAISEGEVLSLGEVRDSDS